MKKKPVKDAEHYAQCPVCNNWFDMRDLSDVFSHEHDIEKKPNPEKKYFSKRKGDAHGYYDGKRIELN